VRRLLIAIAGLAVLACSRTHSDDRVPAGAGPLIAVYKASIDDGHRPVRGAKLAVWAERTNRLHGELIAPVGGVTFTLDAGGGKVCIVDVAAATAYVGDDGPGAIEALAGVRLSVAEAVAALFDGVAPSGLSVTRSGGALGSLPQKLRIADGARSLVLDRIRFERGRSDPRALGTGVPPGNLTVLSIDRLSPEAVR
jgi:hypothetical protein